MTQTTTDTWVDCAARIGRRLVAGAQWNDDECLWNNWVPVRERGARRGKYEPTTPMLYEGTAGIALFLTELARCVDEPEFTMAARGALRHALRAARELPPMSTGFHSGRVGIAYALLRFDQVSEEPEFAGAAEELLSSLPDHAHLDRGLDVIGGAAGAIPVLLSMSSQLSSAVTIETALRLGDRMIREARRGQVGWSWPSGAGSVQDLTGFAHGASGFAHAFLELFHFTGDRRFRYAAEQAMRYERQFFDPDRKNWPDFRHTELSEYIGFGLVATLRDEIRGGKQLTPYKRQSMSAWCHGAPGIGLTRIRATEVLGDGPHVQEALDAVSTTLASIQRKTDNYSLCHGQFGNCETLLFAARVFDQPDLRLVAEQRGQHGRERFELGDEAWPCGTLHGISDPGLMMGEAGIGYYYLRLSDDQLFSVLCPTPGRTAPYEGDVADDPNVYQRLDIRVHLGRTINAFDALQPDLPSVLDEALSDASDRPPVVVAHDIIRKRIESAPDALRPTLEDAFIVDAARYNLTASITDYTDEAVDLIARHTADEIDWSAASVTLADHARIVRTKRDWDRQDSPNGDTPGGSTWIVYRSEGAAKSHRLSSFAALVLESLGDTATLDSVRQKIKEQLEDPDVERLDAAILAHIRAAYDAGAVRRVAAR